MTASQLADELLPHLEALANLHYLIDKNVLDPARIKDLRLLEDNIFGDLLHLVRKAVIDHEHL
jgi:hypothetical protein